MPHPMHIVSVLTEPDISGVAATQCVARLMLAAWLTSAGEHAPYKARAPWHRALAGAPAKASRGVSPAPTDDTDLLSRGGAAAKVM